MKRILIISILLFSSIVAFNQVNQEDFDKKIKKINDEIKSLNSDNQNRKKEIGALDTKLKIAYDSIKTLKQKINENTNAISQTANQLGIQIKETGNKNDGKITEVSESLSKNSLYGIIGVLSAFLLSVLLYWLLSKRQQTDKTDFIDQLSKTKSSIEESLVKEFGKQTDLMESQLILTKNQNINLSDSTISIPDHSLALKVADELTLIERNISLMDASTKGLKQLSRSVEKIKDNLSANGYEIPVLLGQTFNQGMKIVPISTIPDDNLESGMEIITKVIKPQVNYNDKMIQAAQIEVSVGY